MKRLLILAVLVLAGCGGGHEQATPRQPHLPRALAASWRALSNAIAAALAARDGCTSQAHASALRASGIDAVNARRVSPRFQETLLAAVQDLPGRIGCTPPAPAPTPRPHEHPHPPHHHDHGKKHDRR